MSALESTLVDGILEVLFFDPSTRNSLSLSTAEELSSLLQKYAEDSKCQALILNAQGRIFCSGGNLSDYGKMQDAHEGMAVNHRIAEILHELSCFPKPTIAVVNGDCFGGGVELLSAFDFVLSSPHPLFALWQRKIGLTFGWGGGARLEQRLGLHQLRSLALSVESLSAYRAHDLGLIDEIHHEAVLLERSRQRAKALIGLPKAPIHALKNWTVGNEQESFHRLWWNEEHRQVLKAFKKARKP